MISNRNQKIQMRVRTTLNRLFTYWERNPVILGAGPMPELGCRHSGDPRCWLAWYLAHQFPGATAVVHPQTVDIVSPDLYRMNDDYLTIVMPAAARQFIKDWNLHGAANGNTFRGCEANVLDHVEVQEHCDRSR